MKWRTVYSNSDNYTCRVNGYYTKNEQINRLKNCWTDCIYGHEWQCSCGRWNDQGEDCNCGNDAPSPPEDGCFITSATIKTLNKSDSCYELNMFRFFRDIFMVKYHKELVEQYYQNAPLIVQQIDKKVNKNLIYSLIWSDYLSKCLEYIENNEYVEAKNLYSSMYKDLYSKYIIQK